MSRSQQMNPVEKFAIAKKVLLAVIFKKRFPLVVTWHITYRCNLKCGYCGSWQYKIRELDTKSVFKIIEELASLGTKFMKFSGGEPLLREDFSDIIDFCKSKKMQVLINSNGVLFKKKFQEIKGIDEVQFSFDGPKDINDAIRGEGVHDKVIEATEICKNNSINVFFNTVICKYNIFHIPYVLSIAKKYKVGVYFQPADQVFSTHSPKDIYSVFSPKEADYKKIITFLIEEKRKGNRFINNSLSGLGYLYNWPKARTIDCLEALIACLIEPDGSTFVCSMFPDYQKYLVPLSGNFKGSFEKIFLPHPCTGCWCSDIEFNLIKKFKLEVIVNIWKRFSQQEAK